MSFHPPPLFSQLVVEGRLVESDLIEGSPVEGSPVEGPEPAAWRPEWTVALTVVLVVVALLGARRYLGRREPGGSWISLRDQLIMLGLTGVGLIIVILSLPPDQSRNLLNLIGIVFSAAFALSSTTLLGNAMAGVMLRALRNFRPGRFVRVGEHFGMVSERGLIHTEIETQDDDLTILPNLYLVSNPVTVMPASGTKISATVSLGYDEKHEVIGEHLKQAAERGKLKDPFAHVLELGDFSVTWRVGGTLEELDRLLHARSRLRKDILDVMALAGIEILSPTFMNTRALSPEERILPPMEDVMKPAADPGPEAEGKFWVKGKAAGKVEGMRADRENLGVEIEALKKKLADTSEGFRKTSLEGRIEHLESRRENLAETIEKADKEGAGAPEDEPE